MSSNNSLSELGNLLVSSLEYIDNYDNNQQRNKQSDIFYINTAGSKLTHAYEQIRNASEYADDHLFRQRAIRRFLARTLSFHEKTDISNTGEELVTELTLAGYINNGSMSNQDCKNIQSQIKRYYGSYWQYVKIEYSHTKCMQFKNWLLDVLSVRCEQIIQPNIRQVSFTQFAFTYLRNNITKDNISNLTGSSIKPEEYSIILYIAIQQALLKLGQATIRTSRPRITSSVYRSLPTHGTPSGISAATSLPIASRSLWEATIGLPSIAGIMPKTSSPITAS